MKRHAALIPLSHDHQHALAQALRLRRAAALDPPARRDAGASFLEFADARLRPHFAQEEALVARAEVATRSPELQDRREQLFREHAQLLATFEQLRVAVTPPAHPPPPLLVETGQQLTDHIRFEERQLFESLQRELGDDLRELMADVAAGHG